MDDALLILLISESVNSVSLARRSAAVRLMQVIRAGGDDIGASVQRLLVTLSQSAVDVEVRALIELHSIPQIPR